MREWPLIPKLLLTATVFAPTIWAFSTGQMLLAVGGVAACYWVFNRLFMP